MVVWAAVANKKQALSAAKRRLSGGITYEFKDIGGSVSTLCGIRVLWRWYEEEMVWSSGDVENWSARIRINSIEH